MDFTNRGVQPQPAHNPQLSATPLASPHKNRRKNQNNLIQYVTGILGIVVVALVIAVVLALGFNGPRSQERYVYSNKLQAVFLNTGQVYFGNIKSINQQYVVLDNIFYLQTSSAGSKTSTSNANSNVSLVKLGCELHAPYDQMVINMREVTFWENLQSDGQVAKAVAQYQKTYPNGQTCKDQSSSSGSTSNAVQNAPANSSPVNKKP